MFDVYYIWGENGVSLYVGESVDNWESRIKDHMNQKKGLRDKTRRIDVVSFSSYDEMHTFQNAEIERLDPPYNTVHAPSRGVYYGQGVEWRREQRRNRKVLGNGGWRPLPSEYELCKAPLPPGDWE